MSKQPTFSAPVPVAYDSMGQPIFRTPTAPVPVFPTVQRVEPDPRVHLICKECEDVIEAGQEAVEIMHGVSGFSPKSGRPSVVEQPGLTQIIYAQLHLECIFDYVSHMICELIDEPQICAVCEERITESD